jgi:hypothetical protein
MLFQMFGGDSSWKRLLAAQLLIAGVMGMPLMADLANMWKMLWRVFGQEEADVEKAAREILADYDINADLILRGATSNVFGFDLSKRVSLGDVVPGMAAVGSHQKFDKAMSEAANDLAGPGISMLINVFRFVAEDDPNALRRYERIMPSALRNLSRAVRAEVAGGVTDRDGAMLADLSAWEAAGYSVGFLPKKLSDEYAIRSLTNEVGVYWTRRRATLLETYAHLRETRQETDEWLEQVAKYNSQIPEPN